MSTGKDLNFLKFFMYIFIIQQVEIDKPLNPIYRNSLQTFQPWDIKKTFMDQNLLGWGGGNVKWHAAIHLWV